MSTRKLEVVFVGDTKSLDAAFGRVRGQAAGLGGAMVRTGKQLKSTGASLTRGLTVPIVALGAVTGKLALDFDASMSKIGALVGVSQKQVDAWSKQVLSLSKTLPQSPKELADALYFVTSAGFKGKHAMDVLKASARAAAAGLGDTKVVADAVTSAVNSYGIKTLSASHATDVLVGTVREGKTSAEALAPVLGPLAALGQHLGVRFDEVGAALAAMTRVSGDAAQSGTQLTGIFRAFFKPSAQAVKAFKSMGLSIDDVRKSLKDKGLLQTLVDLSNAAKKNGVDIATLFPRMRGLKGVVELTGKSLDKNREIFDTLSHSTGEANKAFERTSHTAKFKLESALSSLQVAGIELGNKVLPAVVPAFEDLASAIGTVADYFVKLPKPVQDFAIGALALGAALGPVMFALGNLIELGGILFGLMNPWTLAAFALGAAAIYVATHWDQCKAALVKAWDALKAAAGKVFDAIGWAAQHGLLGPIPLIVSNWRAITGWLVGALKAAPGALLGAGKWVVDRVIDGIKAMPGALGTAAGWMIGTYIRLTFIEGPTLLIKAGKWIVTKTVEGIMAAPGAIASAASWVVHRVVQYAHDGVGSLVSLGHWIVGRAADGITGAPAALVTAGGWIIHRVVQYAHDGLGFLTDLGGWIVGRVADGLLAVPKVLAKAASDLMSHFVSAVKNALGIHSPSKVFADIGGHVVSGLIKGMGAGDLWGWMKGHLGGAVGIAKAMLTKGLIKVPGFGLDLGLDVLKSGFGALKGLFGAGGGDVGKIGHFKGGGLAGSFVKKWLATALAITGHLSPGNLAALYARAIFESGGNPRAINLWDSNAAAGHPSKGLLQTIDSTFQSYRLHSLPNDIYNPIANAVAAIRYMFARYGHIMGNTGKGYAAGGVVGGWRKVRVGELGPEDAYLPPGTRVTQASQSRGDAPLIGEVHITAQGMLDPRTVANELAWKLSTA